MPLSRAGAAGDFLDGLGLSAGLTTLLEEAMVDSEGYPYYLTATLLETVCAHVGWNTLLAGRSPEISRFAVPTIGRLTGACLAS